MEWWIDWRLDRESFHFPPLRSEIMSHRDRFLRASLHHGTTRCIRNPQGLLGYETSPLPVVLPLIIQLSPLVLQATSQQCQLVRARGSPDQQRLNPSIPIITGGTSLTRKIGSYPTSATSSTPETRRTRSVDFLEAYGGQFQSFDKLDTLEMRYPALGAFDLDLCGLAFGHLGKTLRALLISDATLTLNKFLELLTLFPRLQSLGLDRFTISHEYLQLPSYRSSGGL